MPQGGSKLCWGPVVLISTCPRDIQDCRRVPVGAGTMGITYFHHWVLLNDILKITFWSEVSSIQLSKYVYFWKKMHSNNIRYEFFSQGPWATLKSRNAGEPWALKSIFWQWFEFNLKVMSPSFHRLFIGENTALPGTQQAVMLRLSHLSRAESLNILCLTRLKLI